MSTRRSRIQIKPNLGRKSDSAAAPGPRKPAPVPAAAQGAGDSLDVPAVSVPEASAPPATPEPGSAPLSDAVSAPAESSVPVEQPPAAPIHEPAAAVPPADPPCATVVEPEAPAETPAVAEPTVTRTRPPKRPGAVSAPTSPQKVAKPSAAVDPPTPEQTVVPASSTPSTEPRTRKAAEKQARRRRRPNSRKPPADRSAMTMLDLIYYNPPGNPMPEKPRQPRPSDESLAAEAAAEEAEQEMPDEAVEDEELSADVGPRVRLGPNGEITLDEESLVIRRPVAKPSARAVVYETGGETNYTSFRKQPQGRRTWTPKQTARFYRALSVCGTDFTLMATFFPQRTRQDLKNKFKREERYHRELVDRTISECESVPFRKVPPSADGNVLHMLTEANDPTQFDPEGLEEEEPDEPDEPEPMPKRGRGRGRRRKAAQPEENSVQEEVVEEEVIHEEVILQDEEEEDEAPDTEPAATAPAKAADASGTVVQQQGGVSLTLPNGQIPPMRVQAGQLVFYASRTQEHIVHVFVVAPQQAEDGSELAARLSSPPLQCPSAAPPPTAS